MSYKLKIDGKKMKNADFVGDVMDQLQQAFIESGMTEKQVADKAGIYEITIVDMLEYGANLTLRNISSLAHALDRDIVFKLVDPNKDHEPI